MQLSHIFFPDKPDNTIQTHMASKDGGETARVGFATRRKPHQTPEAVDSSLGYLSAALRPGEICTPFPQVSVYLSIKLYRWHHEVQMSPYCGKKTEKV